MNHRETEAAILARQAGIKAASEALGAYYDQDDCRPLYHAGSVNKRAALVRIMERRGGYCLKLLLWRNRVDYFHLTGRAVGAVV